MEYTEGQREQIQQDYAARRRRQLWMTAPVILVVLALMFAGERGSSTIFGLSADRVAPVLVGVIGLIVVLSFRNWRCPGCGKYLGRTLNPRHCQNCGVQLHP
jgi:hypothetical protein